MTIPNGFFIYADEMRDGGIRVHDCIPDHRRFVPPTVAEYEERREKVRSWAELHELDGKYAESNGDYILAERCRKVVEEVNAVLDAWNERWDACMKR